MQKNTILIIAVLFSVLTSCKKKASNPELKLILGDRPSDNTSITISSLPTVTFNSSRISASTWTQGGAFRLERSFFKFDLNSIPTKSQIVSAKLKLFGNSADIGGHNYGTPREENSFELLKLDKEINSNEIKWQNQPSYDGTILLTASTSYDQNYTVDVTSWIQLQVSEPSKNMGFGLKMANEKTPFRAILFKSGSDKTSSLRPQLIVSYK